MLIETSTTKDENILNFYPPKGSIKTKNIEAVDSKSARKSPLAENIFDIGPIKSVLITSEMISITKEDSASWTDIKPLILAEIMDFFSTENSPASTNTSISNNSQTDIINQISGLINARIRPALQQDGGDISFIRFDNGTVYVKLQGNCVGCPYAMITLQEGVEKVLKAYIPEVKSVKNITEEDT